MNKYLVILLMLASANAYPALIKWVDAEGRVHYSDGPPPPGANTKILKTVTKPADSSQTESRPAGESSAASAPAGPKTIKEREAELKKEQQAKKEAEEKAAKAKADADAKKAYCATLQQNLRTLQEGMRMVEVDASGNRSFLEDEQRQQRIAKIQQDIGANCK